jgi:hypothetical protein
MRAQVFALERRVVLALGAETRDVQPRREVVVGSTPPEGGSA